MSVTKTARDAGEQQKQLRDIEQKAYRAYLALIERQHKERMEVPTALVLVARAPSCSLDLP
jgi:hypothetical protein